MKPDLGQIEKALQNLVEGSTFHMLGSANPESELISQLVSTLEEQIQIEADGSMTAPNIFTLNVPSSFAADVRSNQPLLDTLAAGLTQEAYKAGVNFSGNITITVFPDESLETGQFKVQAIHRAARLDETTELKIKEEITFHPAPPKAFLIVEGSKVFTIDQDVINIGRLLENHLVIDDPRVSRTHAQLRAVKGRHILFDLESSGGTFVNGDRISQISLRPGDVISLAGVPLVYGQDVASAIDETIEYQRPKTTNEQSTTTVRIEDLGLDSDS
jgi:pSer/pThr/pTyr-binding forkhead associated (FHA) protein